MSKKAQLIESIKKNEAYQYRWPYNPQAPLEHLDSYITWLGKQSRLVDAIGETTDTKKIEKFCITLQANGDLWGFLEKKGYKTSQLADFAWQDFPREERDKLCKIYRGWIRDQYELIENAALEASVNDALVGESGEHGQESVKSNLDQLRVLIDSEKVARKDHVEVARKILDHLKLKWDLKKKSSKDLIDELVKRIREQQKLLDKWAGEEQAESVPFLYKGDLEDYHRETHSHLEHCTSEGTVLQEFLMDYLKTTGDQTGRDLNAPIDSLKGSRTLTQLQKSTQEQLNLHKKNFGVQKPVVDETLQDVQGTIRNEYGALYLELPPLLERIVKLTNDMQLADQFFSRHPDYVEQFADTELVLDYQTQKAELQSASERQDQIFLRLASLQEQMDILKEAYAGGLQGEKQFEEHAQRQLDLIRTIPKLEEAMNIYCANYKAAFPLFLWIGAFVRGDGEFFQSKSNFGKAMDFAFKLPLTGLALRDMEKVRSYDTGSMALSLKLGLSVGIDGGSVAAKVGLAVQYDASIEAADNRRFETVCGFTLQAGGGVKVGEFFEVAFKVEIAKWKFGFTFQDHYHWAAWLAARWSHFVARARACDVYMSTNNVSADYRPDPQVLEDLDRLTREFLSENALVQDLYAEIRQYLSFPVERTRAAGMFTGVSVEAKVDLKYFGGMGLALEGTREETSIFIQEEEQGKLVELTTKYQSYCFGGQITFSKFSLQWDLTYTKNHPAPPENGLILNIYMPIPATELAVKILDVFLGALTSQGRVQSVDQVKLMIKKLFTDSFKLAVETVLAKYASSYLAAKEKLLEISFDLGVGGVGPTLQYLRTRSVFSKEFEKSVPVYKGIYLDLGASFEYVRTSEEIASWHSLSYLNYLYYALRRISPMQQPQKGKQSYTVRPDNVCGAGLWEQYVKDNKHQLWHLFVSIGQNAPHTIADLEKSKAKTEVDKLRTACKVAAGSGRYKLTALGDSVWRIVPGYLPAWGQLGMSLMKPMSKLHDLQGFEDSEVVYKQIYPVFMKYMDAEATATGEEEKQNEKLMIRVEPEYVEHNVNKVFKPQSGNLSTLARLSEETRKHIHSCAKCLEEVKGDYEEARYRLSSPVIPEKYWVEDKRQDTCGACNKLIKPTAHVLYTVTNKHHCRICGGIFCEACCPETSLHRSISLLNVRVCKSCKTLIDLKKIPVVVKKPVKKKVPDTPSKVKTGVGVTSVKSPKSPVLTGSQLSSVKTPTTQAPKGLFLGQQKPPESTSSVKPKSSSGKSLFETSPQDQLPQQPRQPQQFGGLLDANQVVQEQGTNNCYIDSTLHAVLFRRPDGGAILQELVRRNMDGSWTVRFRAPDSQVRVNASQINESQGRGPAWQKAVEVACKNTLLSLNSIARIGDIGQLNHVPGLFGWEAVELPDLNEIFDAHAEPQRVETLIATVRRNVDDAFVGGHCVTYLRNLHVVSLVRIQGETFTFFNPLRPNDAEDVLWTNIASKLRETVQGHHGGGSFCSFMPR